MQLHLYCQGKSPTEFCPEELKNEWQSLSDRVSAHQRAFVEAKLVPTEFSIQEILPEKLYLEYQETKGQIQEHVLQNCEKPKNYDFLYDLDSLVSDIKQQELQIDATQVKPTPNNREFLRKIRETSTRISYNIFGTKTGRLTTKPGSFPILTLNKEYRSVIRPQRDCFLEMDFNAFELRVLLALMGQEQPSMDLHEWNVKNIYRGIGTREKAKKRVFAWLYNPNSEDKLTSRYYDRGLVKDRFFSNGEVKTIFDRRIESDDYHAFNYIVQSTASDLFLQQAIKLHKFLEESSIAFLIHDSLVIDFDKRELNKINEIRENFSQTIFGDFPISMKIGKSYGEMKEWKL